MLNEPISTKRIYKSGILPDRDMETEFMSKAEIGSPGTMQTVIKALKEKQVIIKEGNAYRLYDVFLEHFLRYFG